MTKTIYPTIIAVFQLHNQNQTEILLEIPTVKNGTHFHFIPKGRMYDTNWLLAELATIDAVLPSDKKQAAKLIADLMEKEADARRLKMTDQVGWLDDENYVQPHRTFRPRGSVRILHREHIFALGARKKSSSLKKWKSGVEDVCKNSSFVTFSIGIALTGPILKFFTPHTGLVYNFSGTSGTGKSTALQIAQTVGSSAKNLKGLDVTPTALEQLAASSNDGFLALDDMGTGELSTTGAGKISKALSYSVRDGKGRKRAKEYEQQTGSGTLNWRVAVLTNSEVPLSSLNQSKRKQGEETRFVDIFVPKKENGGVLDLLDMEDGKSNKKARSLIKNACIAAEKHHTACLSRFLFRLTRNIDDARTKANKHLDYFCSEIRRDPSFSAIQDRYVEGFGKVYAGLCLGVEYSAVPFDKAHAFKCVKRTLLQSELLADRSKIAVPLVLELSRHVNSESDCPLLEKGQKPISNHSWCFKRTIGKKTHVYLLPDGLRNLFTSAEVLVLEEHLLCDNIQLRDQSGNAHQQVACSWLVRGIKRPRLITLDLTLLNDCATKFKQNSMKMAGKTTS